MKANKVVVNLGGAGLSEEIKQAWIGHIKELAYASETHPYTDALIALLSESDTPEEPLPEEPILTRITATYNGDDVLEGTSASDIAGIEVIGHYSDGSSKTITGWSIDGTVEEGTNEFTISFGGKTTTVSITGYKEAQADPLYHFENFSKTIGGAVINITDSNNFSLDFTGGGTVLYATLSDATSKNVTGLTAGTGLKGSTEWFTIPSGATVEVWLEDISVTGAMDTGLSMGSIGLYDNTSSNWSGAIFCGAYNKTISVQRFFGGEHVVYTADAEKSVRCFGCTLAQVSGLKLEAKVCVTVNGIRYI